MLSIPGNNVVDCDGVTRREFMRIGGAAMLGGLSLPMLLGLEGRALANEKQQGVVTIKNMAVGRAKAGQLGDRSAWIAQRPGQTTIPREKLVEGIRTLLAEVDRV